MNTPKGLVEYQPTTEKAFQGLWERVADRTRLGARLVPCFMQLSSRPSVDLSYFTLVRDFGGSVPFCSLLMLNLVALDA